MASREGIALARLASDHGLSPQRLYWWRSRLAESRRKPDPAGHFIPVRVMADAAAPADASAETGVMFETSAGHRIHVARDFHAATFVRVIDALAASC